MGFGPAERELGGGLRERHRDQDLGATPAQQRPERVFVIGDRLSVLLPEVADAPSGIREGGGPSAHTAKTTFGQTKTEGTSSSPIPERSSSVA